MKKYSLICFLIILSLFLSACRKEAIKVNIESGSDFHTITDMAGRTVEVPKEIKKLYSTGQPGVVALYTLNPDLLLGWCLKLSNDEAKYIDAKYLGLPVLGLMQGNNDTANREEIMKRLPDIILMMTYIDNDTILNADTIQNRTGIPVVLADYALTRIPDAYRFLGDVLSQSERAEALAEYCENVLDKAQKTAMLIHESEKPNVYYAQGSKGLQTAPKSSSHSEVIDIVGGKNIVTLDAATDGRLTVNMEQVLAWNPEVVIVSYSMGHGGVKGDGTIYDILSNGQEAWDLVKAVQNNEVYSTPCFPYNWLDMPPGVNRIIGVLWMGNLLYPERYPLDIRQETRSFYKLFYNKTLTEEELDTLLAGAVKK